MEFDKKGLRAEITYSDVGTPSIHAYYYDQKIPGSDLYFDIKEDYIFIGSCRVFEEHKRNGIATLMMDKLFELIDSIEKDGTTINKITGSLSSTDKGTWNESIPFYKSISKRYKCKFSLLDCNKKPFYFGKWLFILTQGNGSFEIIKKQA